MTHSKAIKLSKRNSCTRVEIIGDIRKHYVMGANGDAHVLQNVISTGRMINTQPYPVEFHIAKHWKDWEPCE